MVLELLLGLYQAGSGVTAVIYSPGMPGRLSPYFQSKPLYIPVIAASSFRAGGKKEHLLRVIGYTYTRHLTEQAVLLLLPSYSLHRFAVGLAW